jgi:hypothetical protein
MAESPLVIMGYDVLQFFFENVAELHTNIIRGRGETQEKKG